MYVERMEEHKVEEILLDDFDSDIEKTLNKVARMRLRRDNFKKGLSLIPKEIVSICRGRMYSSVFGDAVYLTIKYDSLILQLVRQLLDGHGWKAKTDNIPAEEDVYIPYKHEDAPGFEFKLNVETPLKATDDTSCILVPIEWETKTVVKTYDRICMESHPELFDEDGVYVGDNLFPGKSS